MQPDSDAQIVDSWHRNARAWTAAVRAGQIESRRLVTNTAILEAVLGLSPVSVLDIGCGEGWLARALAEHGVSVIGVDVVPALVEQAKQAGGGEFRIASYDQIAAGVVAAKVDVAVANFSLIGKDSVERLLASVPNLLNPRGALVIQTLHPHVASGALPYEDGWRAGSWMGCGDDFTDPAPWYFRTLESWMKLLSDSGFRLIESREPVDPRSREPASVIFIAEPAA
jgi:2-polyprenyl-3-methyl-5-hydroxy-6-metoxy-1,4-benzoquinol methylase